MNHRRRHNDVPHRAGILLEESLVSVDKMNNLFAKMVQNRKHTRSTIRLKRMRSFLASLEGHILSTWSYLTQEDRVTTRDALYEAYALFTEKPHSVVAIFEALVIPQEMFLKTVAARCAESIQQRYQDTRQRISPKCLIFFPPNETDKQETDAVP